MHLLFAGAVAALFGAQSQDSITLDAAMTRARTTRPSVVATGAIVERARGSSRIASLIPNPTAVFEADGIAPKYKLATTLPIAWLPKRGADLAVGRALVDRARADSAQSLAEVGRDTYRAFFGALAADRHHALAAEQRALADSLARLTSRRAVVGDISDLERDQIVLEASRARLVEAQVRESARVARVELARAIVWDGPEAPAPAGALDQGLTGATIVQAGRALDALPSVVGPVADSAAAAARLRSARIAQWPIPGLLVGREWGGDHASGSNLILGIAVPIQLFSRGGEAAHQARGAAAELAGFAAEARLTARAQVDAAHARIEESTRRAQFARDSLLPEARRVRAGAVRLYEEGRTSVLPVLDALRAERDVSRATVAELLAFHDARADLAAILGIWP
jgi:outer membrane protein, heavy metal efflux system